MLEIAKQISAYLKHGEVLNAVNTPALTASERKSISPWADLASYLGSFAGQLMYLEKSSIKGVSMELHGGASKLNMDSISSAAVASLLRPILKNVNEVNAKLMAKERNISIRQTSREGSDRYTSLLRLILT